MADNQKKESAQSVGEKESQGVDPSPFDLEARKPEAEKKPKDSEDGNNDEKQTDEKHSTRKQRPSEGSQATERSYSCEHSREHDDSAPSGDRSLSPEQQPPTLLTGRSTSKKSIGFAEERHTLSPLSSTMSPSGPGRRNSMSMETAKSHLRDSLLPPLPSTKSVASIKSLREEIGVTDIAGYSRPLQEDEILPEIKQEARRLVEDTSELASMLDVSKLNRDSLRCSQPEIQNDVFVLSCQRCGIDPETLIPRSLKFFKPTPSVSWKRAKLHKVQYDAIREQNIALVSLIRYTI